eukprot:jgi/Bigna1/89399/estExt_fgenesh1_pg.C_480125
MGSSTSKVRLSDNYKKAGELGRGSFAVVLKCVRKSDKKEFAVKCISKKLLLNKQLQTRVEDEIKIMSEIKHRNCARMYEVVETANKICIVTELMRGPSLYDYIQSLESFSEETAAQIAFQIVDALAYLHRVTSKCQLICEDSMRREDPAQAAALVKKNKDDNGEEKTSNHAKLEVCILDFGLAKTMGNDTVTVRHTTIYGARGDRGSFELLLQLRHVEFRNYHLRDVVRTSAILGTFGTWSLSSEAEHLISKLLVVQPYKRLTSGQMLVHPWITNKNSYLLDTRRIRVTLARRKLRKSISRLSTVLRFLSLFFENVSFEAVKSFVETRAVYERRGSSSSTMASELVDRAVTMDMTMHDTRHEIRTEVNRGSGVNDQSVSTNPLELMASKKEFEDVNILSPLHTAKTFATPTRREVATDLKSHQQQHHHPVAAYTPPISPESAFNTSLSNSSRLIPSIPKQCQSVQSPLTIPRRLRSRINIKSSSRQMPRAKSAPPDASTTKPANPILEMEDNRGEGGRRRPSVISSSKSVTLELSRDNNIKFALSNEKKVNQIRNDSRRGRNRAKTSNRSPRAQSHSPSSHPPSSSLRSSILSQTLRFGGIIIAETEQTRPYTYQADVDLRKEINEKEEKETQDDDADKEEERPRGSNLMITKKEEKKKERCASTHTPPTPQRSGPNLPTSMLVVSKTDLQASTDKGIMLDSGVGRIVSPKAAEGNLEDAPNPSR